MIISRTPFRISFAGGGTDLAAYYKSEPGAVLSTAINKYMYVTVNKYFDDSIILKYSKTEIVRDLKKVKHPLLRECMRLTKHDRGLEITSMADVVGGTGLGSSSSFTVGCLHALHAFRGEYMPSEQLAAEACEVEIKRVGEPIGKQDQYIAAYGGFQFIEFMKDEKVRVSPVICRPGKLAMLNERLMLFYTGQTRDASDILRKAAAKFKSNMPQLRELRSLADAARRELQEGSIEEFGRILHEGWLVKKQLETGVSNPVIDSAYEAARKAGAVGGKILGAGGGGFLLLFVPLSRQDPVRKAMKGWREIAFKFEPEGSKIIYVSG